MQEAAEKYSESSPKVAARWFNGLIESIKAIASHPESYPLSRESEILQIELRQLLYGVGKRKTHRVLFVIRPKGVIIHQIRHVAQQDIKNL